MKYEVKFTYVEHGYVEIEAGSPVEALDRLTDAIEGGQVTWGNAEVTRAEAMPKEEKRERGYDR